MAEIIFRTESYAIMGACMEVYRSKGCGFLEPVYQDCLRIELKHREIPFVEQPELALTYRGQVLGHKYKPDFICFDKIILEVKAVQTLAREHHAQVMNYLKATQFDLGLLVNFGHYPLLESERIASTNNFRIGSVLNFVFFAYFAVKFYANIRRFKKRASSKCYRAENIRAG